MLHLWNLNVRISSQAWLSFRHKVVLAGFSACSFADVDTYAM